MLCLEVMPSLRLPVFQVYQFPVIAKGLCLEHPLSLLAQNLYGYVSHLFCKSPSPIIVILIVDPSEV